MHAVEKGFIREEFLPYIKEEKKRDESSAAVEDVIEKELTKEG
jgi:hypothetical protein